MTCDLKGMSVQYGPKLLSCFQLPVAFNVKVRSIGTCGIELKSSGVVLLSAVRKAQHCEHVIYFVQSLSIALAVIYSAGLHFYLRMMKNGIEWLRKLGG
jgi:hypothetical protein